MKNKATPREHHWTDENYRKFLVVAMFTVGKDLKKVGKGVESYELGCPKLPLLLQTCSMCLYQPRNVLNISVYLRKVANYG